MADRLTRRSLFGRLGAAVVAAPALAIAATAPVDAAPVQTEAVSGTDVVLTEAEQAKLLLQRYLESPEGMADLQRQTHELMGIDYEAIGYRRMLEAKKARLDGYIEGHQEGWTKGIEYGRAQPLGHNLAETQMHLTLVEQGYMTRLDFFQQAYGMSLEEAQDYQRRIDFDWMVNGPPIVAKPNSIIPLWGTLEPLPSGR